MTLFMIGIGLNDAKDISVKGLEAVKGCHAVYLETYTSLLSVPIDELERFYGRGIIEADRELVEKNADLILDRAKGEKVAFLVIGDVFGATTHMDLYMRALKKGIEIRIVHNASVINAVGAVGLELYKYGKTTSIPYQVDSYNPLSFYEVIEHNQEIGAHTLCLLDIKADEARFMSVKDGVNRLLEAEQEYKKGLLSKDTLAIGAARLGGKAKIVYASLGVLARTDFGSPPHAIIIPGKLHFLEEEALEQWKNL